MNESVDFFFDKESKWQECYGHLRNLVLECGLSETLKWGCPCYTLDNANVVLIHGFRDYCALLFFRGALLPDHDHLLIQQTANVQSARQLRFTNVLSICTQSDTVKEYILAAIAVTKRGEHVVKRKSSEISMPDELIVALKESPELNKAFLALTPGKQRGYALKIANAKLPATRIARIEKYREKILLCKGVDE